jgi:hypothetical protein
MVTPPAAFVQLLNIQLEQNEKKSHQEKTSESSVEIHFSRFDSGSSMGDAWMFKVVCHAFH